MLVLSRKKNEGIVIGDDITIMVVEIRGNKVRLGIQAPKEVPVHRSEIALGNRYPHARDQIKQMRRNGMPLRMIEEALDRQENEEPSDE